MKEMRKNFKFIKDLINKDGQTIKKDTEISIVGTHIFMYNGCYGGEIIDPIIYNNMFDFIQQELKTPCYLKEIPVPYNKC
jgi:hydrogenase maturation factor HypE